MGDPGDDRGLTTGLSGGSPPPILIAGVAHLGERIGGRFLLVSELGRGAMGVVFRARDLNLDRDVAVKVIVPELGADPRWRSRFLAEARTVAALDHPGIVDVYERGEDSGRLYIAMRLVRGAPLSEIVARHPLGLGEVRELVDQVAAALDTAHGQGIVHGDVHPGNILVSRGDGGLRAQLVDFGLSRAAGRGIGASSSGFAGTPAYAPPELIRTGRATPAGDVYALGCVAHLALTGRRPFPGDREAVIAAHLGQEPPDASREVAGVPPAVGESIRRSMAKASARRQESAGRLARDLAAACFGLTLVAAPDDVRAASTLAGDLERRGVATWCSRGAEGAGDRNACAASRAFVVVLGAGGVGALGHRADLLAGASAAVLVPGAPAGAADALPVESLEVIDLRGGLDDPGARRRLTALAGRPEVPAHAASDRCPYADPGDREPLSGPALRAAVEEPALRAGLALDPGLAHRVAEDLEGQPARMALLSAAMSEVWRRRRGRTLTLEAYGEIGGVRGVVRGMADRLLESAGDGREDVITVLARLVSPGEGAPDSPRRAPLGELEPTLVQAPPGLLDRLARAHLVVLDEAEGVAGAQLGHAALATDWEPLRSWLAAHRDLVREQRRLSAAASDWGRSRDPNLLPRGARLSVWRELEDASLTGAERAFLREAHEVADADARRRRARRRMVAAGAAATIVALSLTSTVALVQRNRAQEQRDAARSQARVSQAGPLLADDPQLALALAVQALELSPTDAAWNATRAALGADPMLAAAQLGARRTLAGAVTPDGAVGATGDEDGVVRIVDTLTARARTTHRLEGQEIRSLALVSASDVVAGGIDGTIMRWPADGAEGRVLKEAGGASTEALAVARAARTLFATGDRGEIRRWDLRADTALAPVPTGLGQLTALDVDRAGSLAAVGTRGGAIAVWDLAKGAARWRLDGRTPVTAAAIDPWGRWAAFARFGAPVVVWRAGGHGPGRTRALAGSSDASEVAADPSGRLVMTNDDGGRAAGVRIRDASSGATRAVLPQSTDTVRIRAGAHGVLLTTSSTGTVRTWDTSGVKPAGRRPWRSAHWVESSVDGRRLLHIGPSGRVVVSDGDRPGGLPLGDAGATAGRFGPGGVIVVGYADGHVERIPPGSAPAIRRAAGGAVSDVVTSGPGGRFMAAATGSRVLAWDSLAADPRPATAAFGPATQPLLAFADAGETLLIATWDGTAGSLVEWHWRTGAPPRTVLSGLEFASSMALSADGRRLAYATSTGQRVWVVDRRTGARTLLGTHPAPVFGLATTSDGRFVASGDEQGHVRVWDHDHAGRVAEFAAGGGAVLAVSLSPDGSRLTAAAADGTVRRWRCGVCVADDDLRSRARDRVARDGLVGERLSSTAPP